MDLKESSRRNESHLGCTSHKQREWTFNLKADTLINVINNNNNDNSNPSQDPGVQMPNISP